MTSPFPAKRADSAAKPHADQFRKNFASESHLYIPYVYWITAATRLELEVFTYQIDDIPALQAPL